MNYLGHAYLSAGDPEITVGNMIGDHVKGLIALDRFPEGIKKGIILHRKIDAFSDRHPATMQAKVAFRADYGLYSGAIMDTLYDHFLANDPKVFATEAHLQQFTTSVYDTLNAHQQWLPVSFLQYLPNMIADNWLYNYRNLRGMERALNGLSRRAKYMAPPAKAYEIFITGFYQLNQCYFELFDDLTQFVKIETQTSHFH